MKLTLVLFALLGFSLLAVRADTVNAEAAEAAQLEAAQQLAAESVIDQEEMDGPPAPQLFDVNNQGGSLIQASLMDHVNPNNNLKYIQQFDSLGLEELQAQELEYYRQRWEPTASSREPVSFIEEHETDPTVTMHYTMPVAEEAVDEQDVDNIMSSENDARHTVSEHTPTMEANSFIDLQDRVTQELLEDAGDNSHTQLGLDDDFSDVDASALSALDDDQSLDMLLAASSDSSDEDSSSAFLQVSEDGDDMLDSVDEEDASNTDDLDIAVGDMEDLDAEDDDSGLAEAEADSDLAEHDDASTEQSAASESPADNAASADLDQIESDVSA